MAASLKVFHEPIRVIKAHSSALFASEDTLLSVPSRDLMLLCRPVLLQPACSKFIKVNIKTLKSYFINYEHYVQSDEGKELYFSPVMRRATGSWTLQEEAEERVWTSLSRHVPAVLAQSKSTCEEINDTTEVDHDFDLSLLHCIRNCANHFDKLEPLFFWDHWELIRETWIFLWHPSSCDSSIPARRSMPLCWCYCNTHFFKSPSAFIC